MLVHSPEPACGRSGVRAQASLCSPVSEPEWQSPLCQLVPLPRAGAHFPRSQHGAADGTGASADSEKSSFQKGDQDYHPRASVVRATRGPKLTAPQTTGTNLRSWNPQRNPGAEITDVPLSRMDSLGCTGQSAARPGLREEWRKPLEVAVGRGLVLWTKNSIHLLLLLSQPLSYGTVWALLAQAPCTVPCAAPARTEGIGGTGPHL